MLANGVAPSGDAEFEAVDEVGREHFAAGEAGADAHEEAFLVYLAGNFDDAGAEVRFVGSARPCSRAFWQLDGASGVWQVRRMGAGSGV